MRPTRITVLVALALGAGALGYALTAAFYADVQSPPVYAPLWLLMLALAEGFTASMTHGRLAGRPGTKPINAIAVSRLAVLAKATSPVGALAFGGYTGFLVYVARTDSASADRDVRTAALGMACSLLLVIAALLLERVCRVKPPKDDDHPDI